MKKLQLYFFAIMLAFLVSGNAWGGEKAKLGPCVRACVQAYNPSLADSGADEGPRNVYKAVRKIHTQENVIPGLMIAVMLTI
jgi:hypothetical protein